MGIFNLLGGNTNTVSTEEYIKKGAVVLDVRTVQEFSEGHVEGSKNIPLDQIESRLDDLKALNKPIVACCRSGARSGSATKYLVKQGLDVINGGPWQDVAACIK